MPTERPQYDASLAERRYAACDPDNRLIAAQLEKAWETALLSIAGSGSGDVVMLKFLLGRLLPRERPIAIELPEMEFADDGVAALGSIMRAVSIGAISPDRYRRTRAEAVFDAHHIAEFFLDRVYADPRDVGQTQRMSEKCSISTTPMIAAFGDKLGIVWEHW